MRLIEVDRLITALSHLNDTEHGNRHYLYGIETAKEIAENLPTVDAVPVSWLKEYVNKMYKENQIFVAYPIEDMLKAWEEDERQVH